MESYYKENLMSESRKRTFLKAFSWRITATISTIVISLFITGNLDVAIAIGFFEFLAKILLYYGHERLWLRIKYGFKTQPDYHI